MMSSPAPFIDHTLLRADATSDQVRQLCEEAVEYGFAAVCIPPVYVPLAHDCLYGSGVAVGTVIGFPFGYLPSALKLAETRMAIAAGATEIDMVIHLGAALEQRLPAIESEIGQIVGAAPGAVVKVILECCYLSDALKRDLVEVAIAGGAGFIKTSTGYGSGGATPEDVRLLVAAAAGRIRVKAAGGIRDGESCRRMLAAGATRIGTSAGVAIVQGWRGDLEG
jgi:deoxyribose-phosphate aldolase